VESDDNLQDSRETVPDSTNDVSCSYHNHLTLFHAETESPNTPPYHCRLILNGVVTSMEIDTGASSTIITDSQFKHICSMGQNVTLDRKNLPVLRTYSGHTIVPTGRAKFTVSQNTSPDTKYQLSLLVVPGRGPNLLGRDWLQVMKLDWSFLHKVETLPKPDFASQFPELFKDELGTLKGVKVRLTSDSSVSPRFFRPRTVPYAYRERVEAELQRLEKEGVIRPVQFSDWAAPIVPVLKSNGSIRICGDYKQTVNLAVKVDKYPIPHIDDLFAKITGGGYYTKLDLCHAYQQLQLDEGSQLLTTINTHKGLFCYTRLPFGISSAPGIFQRTIEQVLQNVPMTAVYLDDIVVTGKTRAEHDANVREVLSRLQAAGLRLRKEKCCFTENSITYLGHLLDKHGIHPTQDRVSAIVNAPIPRNASELRSYLGGLNFYHKFLKDISTVLAPLHELLHKGKKWIWGKPQQEAFLCSKKMLQSSQLLIHYDPSLDIIVSCDASPYGLGCVLSHKMPDGSERPVAFASRTLSSAERKYAQVEREALAVFYGVTKFHKYIFGRMFTLLTDHKPLLGLLKEDRLVSPTASPRMQRWGLTLSNYQYSLLYRPGKDQANADFLSRLPVGSVDNQSTTFPVPQEIILAMDILESAPSVPVTAQRIAQLSMRDPTVSTVLSHVTSGWPKQATELIAPYFNRRDELSVHQGCLLWGSRVVIPPQIREAVLRELHEAHPGIVRMKLLARSYVWWPGLDSDIERTVKTCNQCQEMQKLPTKAELHPWEWPGKPWFRVHIDYAGPVDNKWLLVVIDAHSKYMDVHITSSQSTQTTINKLRQSFSVHGIPPVLVSDNGTCFTSQEFEKFCIMNGIKHIRSSPYHPATNGLAERAVQTVKSGLHKLPGDLETRLYRFLAHYRTTPQTTTGRPPAELLMGRCPRMRLDLIKPSLQETVIQKQASAVQDHNLHSRDASRFHIGDPVYVWNITGKPRWLRGVLLDKLGPVTYTVQLEDNRVWRRHVDSIRPRLDAEEEPKSTLLPSECVPFPAREAPVRELPTCEFPRPFPHPAPAVCDRQSQVFAQPVPSTSALHAPASATREQPTHGDISQTPRNYSPRRSQRTKRPPNRLSL